MHFYHIVGGVLALLVAPTVHAGSPRYGIGLSLSKGAASFKEWTSFGGPALTVAMEIPLGRGHMLRPRLDYVRHRQKAYTFEVQERGYVLKDETTATLTAKGFGIDYDYYFSNTVAGWFASAGLAVQQHELKIRSVLSMTTPQGQRYSNEAGGAEPSNKPVFLALGCGYAFDTHWRTELRMTNGNVVFDDRHPATRCITYTLGASYTF